MRVDNLLDLIIVSVSIASMKRIFNRYIILYAIFIVLSGCATPYRHQSVDLGGGYSETQIDRNALKQDARTNAKMYVVIKYMRKHDLTLNNNIFLVSFEGNGDTIRAKISDFALLRSAEVALEHGFRYFIIIKSRKRSYIFSSFGITNTIICFKKRPDLNKPVFDAKTVTKLIRKKYRIAS